MAYFVCFKNQKLHGNTKEGHQRKEFIIYEYNYMFLFIV